MIQAIRQGIHDNCANPNAKIIMTWRTMMAMADPLACKANQRRGWGEAYDEAVENGWERGTSMAHRKNSFGGGDPGHEKVLNCSVAEM